MICFDCKKELGGGFKFKEKRKEGYRCFECLMVEHNKTKGYSALSQIFEELCSNKPKLEGRKYKKYSQELKKQREIISHIVCIFRTYENSWEGEENESR